VACDVGQSRSGATVTIRGSLRGQVLCEQKERLVKEFAAAADEYSAAVARLQARTAISPKAEYERLRMAVEVARLGSEEARLALERHTASHDC
jgi:hypothetical protein